MTSRGWTWMTSVLESAWHLVPERFETFRAPCACGHFVTGPVHRRLAENPPATGFRCRACVRAAEEPPDMARKPPSPERPAQ
ncbi:MAG: hypothetical protein IJH84_10985, partial [Saccharopolyspora sp.]|uniref:hypothetical protein n=1 Tax=Saccharopolyspora sp. TaxID=33915 RepID=UPI0025CB7ACB